MIPKKRLHSKSISDFLIFFIKRSDLKKKGFHLKLKIPGHNGEPGETSEPGLKIRTLPAETGCGGTGCRGYGGCGEPKRGPEQLKKMFNSSSRNTYYTRWGGRRKSSPNTQTILAKCNFLSTSIFVET